jgi:hypothetical protein
MPAPPSLSPPPNFVFCFAKRAARKRRVVFAPPTRAHTTEFLLHKIRDKSPENVTELGIR